MTMLAPDGFDVNPPTDSGFENMSTDDEKVFCPECRGIFPLCDLMT